MRPVDRGNPPRNRDGAPLTFVEYQHARPHLIDNMGAYCSYCEQKIPQGLAVEHIRCVDQNPELTST